MFSSAFTYSSPNDTSKFRSIYTYSGIGRAGSGERLIYSQTPEVWWFRILSWIVLIVGWVTVICTAPISLWFCVKIIGQEERLVVSRLGRLRRTRGPGLVLVLPLVERWRRMSVRAQSTPIPQAQFLTADGAIVKQGGEVWWRVTSPLTLMTELCDVDGTISTLVANTASSQLRRRTAADLQNCTEEICALIRQELAEVMCAWGMEVSSVILSPVQVLEGAPEQTAGSALQPLLSAFQRCSSGPPPPASSLAQQHDAPAPIKLDDVMATRDVANKSDGVTADDAVMSDWRRYVTERLQRSLDAAEKPTDVDAILELEVEGQDSLILMLRQGRVSEVKTACSNPDVTVGLSLEMLSALLESRISVMSAWWSGQVRIRGDANVLRMLG